MRMLHRVDFGATAAMACLTTGIQVTGDEKRPFGGPAQGLMAEVVVVRRLALHPTPECRWQPARENSASSRSAATSAGGPCRE